MKVSANTRQTFSRRRDHEDNSSKINYNRDLFGATLDVRVEKKTYLHPDIRIKYLPIRYVRTCVFARAYALSSRFQACNY